MNAMEFGYSENNREFLPDYGEIDWHQAYLTQHGKDTLSVWGETEDDLGQFCEQLHQANCAFYMNDTNPDFDVLVVLDERDETADFWWSRYQMGDEQFSYLFENMNEEVMVVWTKYPMEKIVAFVIKAIHLDMERELFDE